MKLKYKVIVIFLIFTTFLIGSYILCNQIFLEKYYISRHTQKIKTISNDILKNGQDIQTVYKNLVKYINQKSINVIIMDNDFKVLKTLEDEKSILFDVIKLAVEKNIDTISDKNQITLDIDIKKDLNEKKIFCINKFDKYYVTVVDSISDIKESANIANEFFIIFSVILGVIYLIVIYIISNKITKPILNINDITKQIANLNFDDQIQIKSNDELGQLANNINFLSDELCKNITALKDDINFKKELIRNISHELKTPIGIIKGYTEALKFNVIEDSDQIQKYYNIIIDESDRMDKLIKQLLQYQTLESNIIKPNFEMFNLNQFIEKIVYKFDIIIKEQNITINIKCNDDLEIIADKNLLENALNNFLTNAITYVEFDKIIEIRANIEDRYVKIDVFNTGYNIPEQELDKIWDVFYKIDKSRTKRESNGIGLSFVKAIASLHNGKVYVENIANGVIFSIYIKIL